MGFLRAKDVISGQEGRAYAVIDGKKEEMFYIKSLEATVEKNKAEIRTLGRRGTQHKASGWSGTGSMTIYYVTSLFRTMMLKYINEGIDTYFSITVVNEDPASSIGTQRVTLNNVNLNSIVMASLDTESDALEEEIEFTFEDVFIAAADTFKSPTLG
ncbi:phage tail tube protein [Paenibacillus sp. GCM10012307]|uniref:Phage tail tube protein n=1 Tax=Paenibacillus roseus TaxID=2798579 RepID=A0A934J4T1_9BACL|nr:phage tail tube protein [Paenibacillus roseus]MBJ6360425.1 phage tail tube protein [Paenibacillus roseus]